MKLKKYLVSFGISRKRIPILGNFLHFMGTWTTTYTTDTELCEIELQKRVKDAVVRAIDDYDTEVSKSKGGKP